jgi:hypothetical protein
MDADLIIKPDNFTSIANLMISSLRSGKDQKMALSACEFWSAIICASSEDEELKVKSLRERLPLLLPILMECCLMTE